MPYVCGVCVCLHTYVPIGVKTSDFNKDVVVTHREVKLY